MMKRVWSMTFYVSDLKEAATFYGKILSLEKKYEYSSYVGFDCGGIEIGLIPKKNVKNTEDMPRLEFLVENVDLVYENLKRSGVKFTVEPHDETWGGREATFLDPDGNIIDIVQINWKKYFNVATKGFQHA